MLASCASRPLEQARQEYQSGNIDGAIEILSSNKIRSRDRLLALMEKGYIEHVSGDYESSIKTFLRATDFLEERDYISVSEQSASLAINDWVTTYRGEYAERLWIHTYQMMNFLLLGQHESAAVEARRALQVYADHPKALRHDFFSRALIGVSFDNAGLANDAYVEYLKLAESLPDPAIIAPWLVERARHLGIQTVATKYAALSSESVAGMPATASTWQAHSGPTAESQDSGELVIFVESGQIPSKIPGDLLIDSDKRISFPFYPTDQHSTPPINLQLNGETYPVTSIETSLSEVAADSLALRGKKIAAKQVLRIAAKKRLVDELGEDSQTSAAVLNAVFFLLEEADTRGWSSLPSRLQLIRLRLPVGMHNIALSADPYFTPNTASETIPLLKLENMLISSGQTRFFKIRLVPG